MASYLLRRLLVTSATLAFAAFVVFTIVELLPGNAAQTMLGATATPEAVAALAHKLGLDKPPPLRFLEWIGGLARGDFGLSYAYNTPIGALLGDALAVSAPLALMAMMIAAATGFFAGLHAARRRGGRGDALISAFSQIGLAIPNFWFGIVLVLIFAVHLRIAPSGGFPGWSDPLRALGALILPALSLGLVQGAVLTRIVRSALIDAEGEDFMRTARAKGLSREAALLRHALPNAMTPILTVGGLQFAFLLAGAIVIENVFTLPGLGRLVFQSISNRDALVVEDCVLVLAAIVIAVNFLVDFVCAAIDPRLRARSA